MFTTSVQAFVTHGGLLSVMEAIYHETILVGIPLANDQVFIYVMLFLSKV